MIQILKRLLGREEPTHARRPYAPRIPAQIDERQLLSETASFFRLPLSEVETLWAEHRQSHEAHGYASAGERKTLSFEEAFILSVILSVHRPPVTVEIGTHYGRSTRRLIDSRQRLGVAGVTICFDIVNYVRHFDPNEATLVLKDVTHSVREDVLTAYEPGVIYLDAHPFELLKNVVHEVIKDGRWILAIHDCSAGLCNPAMALSKDDPNITSRTGLWERWVLAEAFGIADPLSSELDDLETATHRLRVFTTPHGLSVVLPKAAHRPA